MEYNPQPVGDVDQACVSSQFSPQILACGPASRAPVDTSNRHKALHTKKVKAPEKSDLPFACVRETFAAAARSWRRRAAATGQRSTQSPFQGSLRLAGSSFPAISPPFGVSRLQRLQESNQIGKGNRPGGVQFPEELSARDTPLRCRSVSVRKSSKPPPACASSLLGEATVETRIYASFSALFSTEVLRRKPFPDQIVVTYTRPCGAKLRRVVHPIGFVAFLLFE